MKHEQRIHWLCLILLGRTLCTLIIPALSRRVTLRTMSAQVVHIPLHNAFVACLDNAAGIYTGWYDLYARSHFIFVSPYPRLPTKKTFQTPPRSSICRQPIVHHVPSSPPLPPASSSNTASHTTPAQLPLLSRHSYPLHSQHPTLPHPPQQHRDNAIHPPPLLSDSLSISLSKRATPSVPPQSQSAASIYHNKPFACRRG